MRLGGCNQTYCGIQKAREDMTLRILLVAGAWRAQVHWVDQAWRAFCYSCTPTLFSSESILTQRVVERFFTEFFGFLFNNTFWCYFVVASFFHYSCALLLLFSIHVYALEWYQFIAHIYSCFTLCLSKSKINLAMILIGGLKKLLCFHTNPSFHYI